MTIPYNQLRDLINATIIRPPPGADEAMVDQLKQDKEVTRQIFLEHKRSLRLRIIEIKEEERGEAVFRNKDPPETSKPVAEDVKDSTRIIEESNFSAEQF